jgi:hypothetical protein
MEKLIARWSYWLGIACMVIAVIWKIVVVFGYWHLRASTVGAATVGAATPGATTVAAVVGHSMFLHGSIMFLVATIASVGYAWLKSQKP